MPAGYAAARVQRQMHGQSPYWLIGALSFALPGAVFFGFSVLNVALWAQGASSAVPFSAMGALLALWLGLHVPLLAAGATLGFRAQRVDDPVHTNLIPRQVCYCTVILLCYCSVIRCDYSILNYYTNLLLCEAPSVAILL